MCKSVPNYKLLAFYMLLLTLSITVITAEQMTLQHSICPNNTVARPNTTLYDLDFELYWYPWLHRVFPACWASLQPLLCLEAHNTSFLWRRTQVAFSKSCKAVCRAALTSCWMLDQFRHKTSSSAASGDILNCTQYVNKRTCNINIKTVTHPVCLNPLHVSYTQQDNEVVKNHYRSRNRSFTGCSLVCDSELNIHQPQHQNVSIPIILVCCIGFVLSLFTIITFLVDWKCQNRYPALILFILNSLFVTCLLGWILQFLGIGNEIHCSPERYQRLQEPRYQNTSWCIISFILIYFSSMAIGCWFVILTYSWYISFKGLGSTKNSISGKVRYFHITAWSTSLLMTGIVLFLGEVDAHEFTNICFVGYRTKSVRVVFVYTPFVVCLMLGELFLVYGISVLRKVRADCRLFVVPRAASNITRTIQRLVVYALVIFFIVLVSLTCCVHEDYSGNAWRESYNEYLRCMIVSTYVQKHPLYGTCEKPDERKLVYFYIKLGSLFLACVATNSWTWTSATGRIWVSYWKRFGSVDTQTQLQISWYHRMQKKKIAPFVPPINPDNPLETIVARRASDICAASILNPFQNVNQLDSGQPRRHSDDIRSVFELFSARRGTKGSVESEPIGRFPGPLGRLNRSLSVASLQNYGHLAHGNFNYNTEHNLLRKLSSSNFTTAQVRNVALDNRCSSNLTVTHLKNIHDNLLTPISLAHRNSIVADCIPYTFMQKVPLVPGELPNQPFDPSLSVNQGMTPCSITSVDDM